METNPLLLQLSKDDSETLEKLRALLSSLLGKQFTAEEVVCYCIRYAASSQGISDVTSSNPNRA